MVSALVVAAFLPSASAQQPTILYKLGGEPRPGSELTLYVVLAKVEDAREPRPIHDASYLILYRVDGEVKELEPIIEDGIARVTVKVPLSTMLGGTISFMVNASSEFYGITTTREFSVNVRPDLFAVLSLAIGAVAVISPVLTRWGRWR